MDDKNPNLRNNPHDPNYRKDPNPSSKVMGIIALAILALIVLFFVFRTPDEMTRNVGPATTNPNSTLQQPAPNQTLDKTKTTTPL